MVDVFISGTGVGNSSVNGSLSQYLSINGSSDGYAIVNGSIVYNAVINGTSIGASLTQASLNLFIFSDGYVIGGSTTVGGLNINNSINGLSAGSSSTSNPEINVFNVLSFLNLIKSQVVYASPKQIVKFVFEVRDGYDQRVNSPTVPIVVQIFNPSIEKLSGYPQLMEQLDVGLYTFSLTMPIGIDNLGDFIVDIGWTNPDTNVFNQTFYQIISRMSPSRGGGYIIGVR